MDFSEFNTSATVPKLARTSFLSASDVIPRLYFKNQTGGILPLRKSIIIIIIIEMINNVIKIVFSCPKDFSFKSKHNESMRK